MMLSLLVLKSVAQGYRPTRETQRLLEIFRRMVNDCVETGLFSGVTDLKRLSALSVRDQVQAKDERVELR